MRDCKDLLTAVPGRDDVYRASECVTKVGAVGDRVGDGDAEDCAWGVSHWNDGRQDLACPDREQRGNEAEDLIRRLVADCRGSGAAAKDDLPGRYLALVEKVLMSQRAVAQADAEMLAAGSTECVPAYDDDRRRTERFEASAQVAAEPR